jgi:hypothetical protein
MSGKKNGWIIGACFIFLFHFFVSQKFSVIFFTLAAVFCIKLIYDFVQARRRSYQETRPVQTPLKLLVKKLEEKGSQVSRIEIEVETRTETRTPFSSQGLSPQIPDFDQIFKQKEI